MALAGLVALAVAMGIGRFAFTPILPMMQAEGALTVAAGAWLATANYVGTLVGTFTGVVMRFPAHLVIRGSLVTVGVATVAMGFEHGLAGWIVLRTVAGIATGWILVFASAWSLERLALRGRPIWSATLFSGYGVGIAIAGGVCLVLARADAASRQAWMALGILALIVTAVTWRVFAADRAAPGDDHEHPAVPRDRIWTTDAARLVLCYGVFGFGYIVPATFLPVMARQAIPDPSMFGWAWPIFGVAAAGATFVASAIVPFVALRRLWSLGHVILAVGVTLPVISPGPVAVLASALLVGSMFTVITMAGFQEGRRVAGARGRQMIAAMASAFSVGQIAGPVCVGALIRPDDPFSTPLLVASLLLLASAGALVWR